MARANLVLATRGELGPETRISRVRTALVGAQIAAAVLCLIGANGLAGEVTRMASADTGLDFGHAVNVMVPDDRRAAIAQRLEEHPAIERVAVATRPPLTGELRTIHVVPSGSGPQVEETVGYMLASPGYFPLLQIDLTRGRLFTEVEAGAQAPVVVVSRATAQRFWPGADPIGQTLEMRLAADWRSAWPFPTRNQKQSPCWGR